MKSKKKPDPHNLIIIEPLEVRLTEREFKEASKNLAEALRTRNEIEAEIDSFRKQKKAEIAKIDATVAKCAQMVNSEKEFRNTECVVQFDWEAGKKTTVRLDTGEIVRTQQISNAERQTKIDMDEEADRA